MDREQPLEMAIGPGVGAAAEPPATRDWITRPLPVAAPLSDEQILRRPIIVLGATRSGTTVLGELLGEHPDLVLLREPRLTWSYGNESHSDYLRPQDCRPEVRAHIRSRFASFVREGGGNRVLEKYPGNAIRMPFVDAVLPDCRFVHIIRNGYDSVLSSRHFFSQRSKSFRTGNMAMRLKEMKISRIPYYAKELVRRVAPDWLAPVVGASGWGVRIPAMPQLQNELSLTAVCSLQWRASVEAACQYGRSLPSDRYLECHLEDLSPALLHRITSFCGIERPESILDAYAGRFDASRSGGPRREADPADLREIRAWIEPTMQWLGYDSSPSDRTTSAHRAAPAVSMD